MAVCRRRGRCSGQAAVDGLRVRIRTDLLIEEPIEVDVGPMGLLRHYAKVLL